MIDAAELVDNEFLRQFELKTEGHFAKIEYSQQERKIFLTKLIVPEAIKDENFTEDFLKLVLNHIKDGETLSVVPTSPEIAKFIRRNRQYKSLLPVGLRI